jgi:hypothetical protein
MITVVEFLDSIAGKLQSAFVIKPTASYIFVELTDEERIKLLTAKDFWNGNAHQSLVRFNYKNTNVVYFINPERYSDLLKGNQNPVAQKLWEIFMKAKSNATTAAALESLWPIIKSSLRHEYPYLPLLIKLESNQDTQAKLIADFLNSEGQGVFEAEVHYPDANGQHYGDESITLNIRKVKPPTEPFQDEKLNELLTIFKNQEGKAERELEELWSTIISAVESQVDQDPERFVWFIELTNEPSNIAKLKVIEDFLNCKGQDVFKAKLNFPDENDQRYGQDNWIRLSIEKVGQPTKPVQNDKIKELLAIFNSNGVQETKSQQLEKGGSAIGPTSASSSSLPNTISQNTLTTNEEVLQPLESGSDALNPGTGPYSNQVKVIDECLKMESSSAVRKIQAQAGATDINGSITLLHTLHRQYTDMIKPENVHNKAYEQMTAAIKDQIATTETLRNYINKARRVFKIESGSVIESQKDTRSLKEREEILEDIRSLEELTCASVKEIDATDDLQSKIDRIVKRHKDANDIVKRLEKHDPDRKFKNFRKCVAVFLCGLIGLLALTALACAITYACPAVLVIIAVAGITKASLLASAAGFLLGFLPGAGIGTSKFFFGKSAPSRFLDATQKVLVKQEQLPKPTQTEPKSGIYVQPKRK